jgi:replication factor C large subunit
MGPGPLPLTEKLRPLHLGEVVGNPRALSELKRWADGWAPGRPLPRLRAALLEGPPGVGKTTTAWALARDRGWVVVEMNASDARNRSAIEAIAGRASLTNALSITGEFVAARDGGRTLILLDEADCLTGRATEEKARPSTPVSLREFLRGRYGTLENLARAWGLGMGKAPATFSTWEELPSSPGRAGWARWKNAQKDLSDWRATQTKTDLSDRGGLGAIAQLVRSTRQPVVLTVNDARPLTRYSPVFRQGVAHIRFGPVEERELRPLLRRVIRSEGLEVQEAAVEAILERSQGDVRAALTDLDAVAPLPVGPAQLAVLGGRDRSSDFERFIAEVFAHPRYYRSVEVRERLDVPPDDLFPWIEENLPHAAVDAGRRSAAFEVLGRAELMLSRARRYRHYGLWSYSSEVMTGGVGVALDRPSSSGTPDIRFPTFLIDMGRSRGNRQARQAVLGKVDPIFHLSMRKGQESVLPFLFRLFDPPSPGFRSRSSGAVRAWIIRRARLEPEEVGFLLGVEPDSELVAEEVARAEGGAVPPSPAPHRGTDASKDSLPRNEVAPNPEMGSTNSPSSTRKSPRMNQKKLGEF